MTTGLASTVLADPAITGIVNIATFKVGAVAPGSLVSVFGSQLGAGTASATSLPLPTLLQGTRVLFNGVEGPLFYVSPGQINVQVPAEAPTGTVTVTVRTATGTATSTLNIATRAEQFLVYGTNQAVAQNPDGSINAPDKRARNGDAIVLYGTGAGPTTPAVGTNQAAPSTQLAVPPPLSVYVGGHPAQVLFAGLTPGTVGLMQVNLKVPDVPSGNQPVIVWTGHRESNAPAVSINSSLAPTRTAAVCGFAPVATRTFTDWTNCATVDVSKVGDRPLDAYKVTKQNVLLFDPAKRAQELKSADPELLSKYCALNVLIGIGTGVPSLQFSSAQLALTTWTATGQQLPTYSAHMVFSGLTTSDGLSLPKFAFQFDNPPAPYLTWITIDPTQDANLKNITGLTAPVSILWNDRTGQVILPLKWPDSAPLRRLIYAIATGLPELLQRATSVPATAEPGLQTWSLNGAVDWAKQYRSAITATPQQILPPVPNLTCSAGGFATLSCDETVAVGTFKIMLQNYGAEYFAFNSRGAFQNLAANLKAWAAGNALLTYPGLNADSEFTIKYNLLQVAMPLMQDWAAMQADPDLTADIRSSVNAWLDKLMPFAVAPYGGTGNPNNSGYLQMASRMAWGILKGNNSLFQDGVQQYWVALHQMRPDGSLPLETLRGKCALNYQSQALAPLIDIAEMGALQGYDLYSLNVDGRTIHDAVRFMLDAAADTSLLDAYFQDGSCPLAAPDQPYYQEGLRNSQAPSGFPTAWLEMYAARFPGTSNSNRLIALLNGGLAGQRPLVFNHSAGSTTCMAGAATSIR